MSKSKVPNPYELTEADAQKLGYVDFDLETLELEDAVDDVSDEEGDSSGDITHEIVEMLLETDESISDIKKEFGYETFSDFKNYLVKYFRWMQSELLEEPDVTYLTVNAYDELKCAFASLGTRFWQFLMECKLFSPRELRELSVLIYHYLKLHPQEILKIRSEAVRIRLKLATEAANETEPVQRKSVIDQAFKPIDKFALFDSLELFCKTLDGAAERAKLTKVLNKTIKSIFSELKPELVPIGSVPNASIDYRVLHYQLSFGIAGSMILDDATRILVETPILQGMKKIGLNGFGEIDDCTVVFNLDEEDDGEYKDHHRMIVISFSSESLSFCKLVNFYLGYDFRFGPMVLLLKYYLTESKIFATSLLANESFIWLIICFLQQTKPAAVLPALSTLKLDKMKPTQIEMLHFCTDLNSIDASSNSQSIGRLVVKFLEWFCDFKFDSFLKPRDGKSYANNCYREHCLYDSDEFLEIDHLCIVNPFTDSLESIYKRKDVEQWQKCFTKLKNDYKIDSKNYLLLLTDPNYFFDPESNESNLPYMKSINQPKNPYRTSSEDAEDLQYPQNVSSLKVEPKSNRFANQSTSSPLVDLQFSRDFIFTSKSIGEIIESYNPEHLRLHCKNIVNYFRHLKSRLMKDNLTYDELIEDKFDDYAAYGERFWQFLSECKLFLPFLRYYTIIIYRYLEKFPQNILRFRTQLRDVYLKIASGSDRKPKVGDSNLVTYTHVDQKSLHSAIKGLEKTQEQVDHLIKELCPTNKLKQFADFIVEKIPLDKNLAALKLSLERVNVLDGGFNLSGDFYFVVKFGSISEKLDRTTFRMALQVIQKSIAVRFELRFSKIEASSFRFKPSSSPSTKTSTNFIANLISTSQWTYNGNAFLLLSRYSPRFRKMVIILRYWFTLNKFDYARPFYANPFNWLIVHFLQQTSPPVLPPLEPMLESGDVKSVEPSTNKGKSTAALIVEFLKFCTQFDFANQVICPLDGTCHTKEEYCKLKKRKKFIKAFSVVENPLSKATFYLVEISPKSFVEFVTKLLNEEKISSKNCYEILTNPGIKIQDST